MSVQKTWDIGGKGVGCGSLNGGGKCLSGKKSQCDELYLTLANISLRKDVGDEWWWMEEALGSFSVNLAYIALHMNIVGSQNIPLMEKVWNLKVQPKANL